MVTVASAPVGHVPHLRLAGGELARVAGMAMLAEPDIAPGMFAVTMPGDAMWPEILPEWTCFVDPAAAIRQGDVVLAIADGRPVVRCLFGQRLIAYNANHPDLEPVALRVVGRITWVTRSMLRRAPFPRQPQFDAWRLEWDARCTALENDSQGESDAAR